jgi:hypothetical protein
MGRKKHARVTLQPGWWGRLVGFCKNKWMHDHKKGDVFDVYKFTGISRRTMGYARKKEHEQFTESTFNILVGAVGYRSPDELHQILRAPDSGALSKTGDQLPTENPKAFVLITKREMLGGTDFRELNLGGGRLEVLKCKIETESPYFRFGFKLFKETAKLFGDQSIITSDENLIVHIGRNNWDRPNLGISAKDIFFTDRLNGVRLEVSDKKMFSTGPRLSTPVELRINSYYIMTFSVESIIYRTQAISPDICRRIVVAAWGDGEEYKVNVSDISVNSEPNL